MASKKFAESKEEDLSGKKSFARNVGASYLGQFVFIIFGFILPRVIDQKIGQTALGIWDFGWSLVSYLSLSMIGIGSSVNRYVARLRSEGSLDELNRIISTVNTIQLAIAGFVLIMSVVLAYVVPIVYAEKFENSSEPVSLVIGLLGASLAVQMAYDAWRGVISGCHRWDYYHAVNSIGYTITALAMILSLLLGGGLGELATIYFVSTLGTERMAKQGLAFDIRASRMDLQFGNSKYTKRLLKPLHRGRFLELIRSGLLSLSGSWRRNHVAWQQRNRELIGVISDKNSTQFVVDSSKTGLRLRYLKSIPGLDIHVIRLTRDGRAVTLTYLQPAEFADARKSEMRGGGTGEYRGYGLDMLGAIERWWRSNEEADRAFQSVPETNRLQISYEDLCTETTVVMSRIFSFLGVKDNLSYREFRDNDHHLVGNGMRLDGSSEVQLDDRWRQSLGESDMKVFEDHARDKNMKYGYG